MYTETVVRDGKSTTFFAKSRKDMLRKRKGRFIAVHNDTTVLRPEKWANESIRLLYEDMKFGSIVYKNFNQEIARYGETVHIDYPSEMRATRKQNDLDNLTSNTATANQTDVVMDQRIYVSFLLGDGERSKSFKDLFEYFMKPQIIAQSRLIDRVIGGQVYQFLGNYAGGLGLMNASTASDYLIDARTKMNQNKVPDNDRWLALASPTEAAMQKVDLFKSAERVGDGGQALRDAILGRKHGFNMFMSLNTPSVTGASTLTTTTVSTAASAGATTVTVASVSNIAAGQYITIEGDMTPCRVASISSTTLTLTRALYRAVAAGAVVTPYSPGAINQTAAIAAGDRNGAVSDGYPTYWAKEINVDGTGVPVVGQLVSFKAAGGTVYSPEYCIVDVQDGGSSTYNILLDRPLESTVANNDIVYYGPNGDFNFGIQGAGLALVNRSLALPLQNTGVLAATGLYNDMSLRTTISYDGLTQGTRVTVDCLLGVKKLQTARGVVLLG